MVSRQGNRPLVSNVHSHSEPAMTVRSVLLKRDPGRSMEGERIHHRRRHKTQQVRFKDLADGPEEVVVGGRTPEGNCQGMPALRNWYPARPCSLTLPMPRKACMSTAIQTSPSLQKHFPACRARSKSVSDLGAEDDKEEGGDPPSDHCPAPELAEGQDAEEEEGEEDHEGVVKEQQEAAMNGRMVETVATACREHCPSTQDREKVCEKTSEEVSEKVLEEVSQKVQDYNSNGSSACHRAKDTTVPKAVPDTLLEGNFKAFIAGQHCATKGVRILSAKPCSPISKVSPPSSKDNDMDRYSLSQRPCHKLKAPRHDLDGDLSDYGKTEPSPTNPNHTLAKDQVCTFPKSCLKTPLNPKQPGVSHRTDQSQLCISVVDHSQPTDVKNQPSQPLAKSPVRSGEGHSGPALKADVRLELVLSGGNPQANATEPAAATGSQGPKSGRNTQYEITSLQSRLQNMEDVLQTSQQTIKVLLDVIQDLEKKEAVRDGRQSYHTGQDIVNCGTCRDCACIIYSVEHDFRQQEGRFHRVLSSLETEAGQSAELPSTPSKQGDSPTPRLAARTEPKKSKRKCFWFL
ncbi:protein INSYN2B-like [Amblyraja radiata]|uniref:protein INSYN2B-like n=1 Tax=Amblyraja radiata TaxID=386614 RepID=UPI0014035B80|nr:protein INSYN2B-like [Amblyraja radiata]